MSWNFRCAIPQEKPKGGFTEFRLAYHICSLATLEHLQTCHLMNRSPPSGPFIFSIPNEIVHHIFSFLHESPPDDPFVSDQYSHDEAFVRYQVNGKDYEVAQVLVPPS